VSVRGLRGALTLVVCGVVSLGVFCASALAAPEPPETGPAGSITASSASLSGVLNPHALGEVGVYYFVFAAHGALCTEGGVSVEAATPGFQGEVVTPLVVTGLEPGTSYAYCLVDRSEETGEQTVGSSRSFTTLTAPPTVEGEATSGVGSTAATLEAQVNPDNQTTSCTVEYGLTSSYGTSAACEPGSLKGFGDERVSLSLTGLDAGTTYHFRVVAENAAHEKREGQDQVFATVPVANTDPVGAIAARTAMFNGHLALSSVDTDYLFEYNAGSECTGGGSTPAADAGMGSGNAPVSSKVTGLLPHTLYTVCMVTSNDYGSQQGSPVSFTTLVAAPANESESVTNATGDSAELTAQINPDGGETTYHFEYGTTVAYGQSTPESSSIGASDTGQQALAQIQGLQPATTYHYRVVASNSQSQPGGTPGEDQTFTTQPLGGELKLPDNRAWELVSPPSKQGATIEISTAGGLIQASGDGERIAYIASAPLEPGAEGNPAPNYTQVLSARHPGEGWSSQVIASPHNEATGVLLGHPTEYEFFSSDLSQGLVSPVDATPLAPLGGRQEKTIYIREPDGSYKPLVSSEDVTTGEKFGGGLIFEGATPNLDYVMLNSGVPLTSGTEAGGSGLYEWGAGALHPVSILPDGTAAENTKLGYEGKNTRNAISEDGSRVIWSEYFGVQSIYMRNVDDRETVQVDAPEVGSLGCGEYRASCKGGPSFQLANDSATQVFFSSEARLTTDSTSSSGAPDLYMFEVTNEKPLTGGLTDLTVDSAEPADVQGTVIGAGEDGSSGQVTSLYFVAEGVLAANENADREKAVAGADNLYVMQRSGSGWTTSFIAALSSEDGPDWGALGSGLGELTGRVSPDGEYLAFMSDKNLTGYDNRDVESGAPDEEVFLYDAGTHTLRCASCDPTGARPRGVYDPEDEQADNFQTLLTDRPNLWPNRWLGASVPGWTLYQRGDAAYQSRYLSDSGRLFFDSPDTLVPQATNGMENVYEYEPVGVGSCEGGSVTFGEQSDGCVGLISSGASGAESAFLDASETGDDVFFLTTSQLVGKDYDNAYDVYDAHVCSTGSPCPAGTPVVPPPCTTADSCKAAPTPQPAIFGAPSSSTFNGAGNVTAGGGTIASKAKPLTRAEKLARALKSCRKQPARKRAGCRSRAEKRYGVGKRRLVKGKSKITRGLSVGTGR
jgi:hypothetical protein